VKFARFVLATTLVADTGERRATLPTPAPPAAYS
jgi:hypothetical protein